MAELADCEHRVVNGRETPPCPHEDAALDIEREREKFEGYVSEACSQVDPSVDLGLGTACPSPCEWMSVYTTVDLIGCVECMVAAQVGDLISAAFPVSQEETDPTREVCREEIGRRTVDYGSSMGRRRLNRLNSCGRLVRCGQIAGPCPDTEAQAGIDQSEEKNASKIRARCSGLDPQDLDFPPQCPSLDGCGSIATDDLDGLIDCFTCAAEATVGAVIDTVYHLSN